MIGHIPTPNPDELLYSLCARYAARVRYPSNKSVLLDLFNSPNIITSIGLPCHIGLLYEAIPPGSELTVNRFINEHTLLPYFAPFIPSGRVAQLRQDMEGSGGPRVYSRSGVMAGRVPEPERLRFCPACKTEEEKRPGETYWHRLHQLPGIEVCSLHQVFLESSSVGLRTSREYHQFITAAQASRVMPVRYVDVRNHDHAVLLQLARDAEWLLEHPSAGTSLKTLHIRYLRLLINRGLATYTGSIHVKKFLHEFGNYYSPTLLKLLNCGLRGGNIEKTNWLLRLVRPPKHAQHPLYHLLLIQFLACTVEEFFQLPDELHSFGEGPWPCLNPVADHYKQPVIMECRQGDRLRYGKPTGNFSCECGFAYVRTGPDSSPEDKFRVGRIASFGLVWEAKLKQLLEDSSLSLSEVGRRLGVNPLTVRRHAARLKLPFSLGGRKTKTLKPATQLKGGDATAARHKKQRTCRSRWLSLMERNPKVTLKTLRSKLPREYAWLLQNDAKWLRVNRPPPARHHISTSGVDWKRRDAEYAVAVKAAALRLKNAAGRPVRVTKTAIGRAVGANAMLRLKLHKMPLTAQVLASVVETREQYAVRRVWWAAYHYLRDKILPRRWQLILRANVYSLRYVPEVECVIDAAIKMLEPKSLQKETA
jgi:hypothetical protein